MSVITVKDLKKSFHDKEVIKGLDFTLESGKCTALIGPNGAGKTTILRMLSGLMKPTTGSIHFQDQAMIGDIRKIIGYLPQFPVFYEWMTGMEFLHFVGRLGGLTKNAAKERAEEMVRLVGIADAKNQRIGKYSGGMKQRLGIAQAIIHNPKLVMLDEPVSALDPFGRREVLDLLGELKLNKTILFSTHILNDAEEVCDNILFLHEGRLVESGTMEQLQAKHQQTKIVVEFRARIDEITKELSSFSSIDTYLLEGKQLTIYVNDLEQAKVALLRKIADLNWPLVRFEVGRLTLEEVFLEVVKK